MDGGFKQKMVRCVALALVFGLVAGGVFVGTGYAGMKALGIDNNSKAQTSDTKSVSTTKVTGTTTSTKSGTTTSSDISGIVDEVMPSIVAITNMTEVAISVISSEEFKITKEKVQVPELSSDSGSISLHCNK